MSTTIDVPKIKDPWLHKGMKPVFILTVTCFAAWGLAGNMTDPLVKVFSSVFSMSNFQSSLVQFAYYGAYFALALPAAFINMRLGYKGGVVLGLLLAATGGFLFFPAAQVMTFGFFIFALFTLAAGLSILETSANPFVMAMGPQANATRRLNFAQAFNPIGSNLGVLIAAMLILPHVHPATAEMRAQMPHSELVAMQSEELFAVMGPYVALASLYLVIAIGIMVVKVPKKSKDIVPTAEVSSSRLTRLLRNKRYSFGVVAQFFNIAAQTCIWTYTLHYVTEAIGVPDKEAGIYLQISLLVFLVFRFLMVALMGRFDPRKLMLVMTTLGVALAVIAISIGSTIGVAAIISMSACLSLLFPTIYGVALEGLGEDTKYGAAGLVMAIVGGALMPLVQGKLIDVTSAQFSYIIPGACFAICGLYAIYTLKTSPVAQAKSIIED
ncbi:L-fucose:H+ symporter permease [Trueperella pyogenes]|uniref:L-fucose:H+ symporter permease n=1 Tax=Trueperella pyogenes TaxID=1661 RepID=A0ABV3NCZ5_9ACTO